ncbi:MAG: NAD(P)/FAD-dependent oxidoreductase [Eubacterium sp.]|nr:NAD(P)/FAD-dependent oxidoreductase [Eubacterium sp.]
MSKVLVIGGGAAGMMAGIAAAYNGNEVLLVEKNEKLGKKIYITGKGRCNVTNASDVENHMNQVLSNGKFLYSAYHSLDAEGVCALIESTGVALKTERGNRVFPQSDKSSDIIWALTKMLKDFGVTILYNAEVKKIEKQGEAFVLTTTKQKLRGDYCIVATGGLSYPTTGSTGDGYEFAKKMGHEIVDLYPSLVPFNVKEEFCRRLQGLALKNVSLEIVDENGKEYFMEQGEMLFTHFGISGPLVLTASAYISGLMKQHRFQGKIDLKPALTEEVLDKRILKDFEENRNKNFQNAIDKLLPKKLIPVTIEMSGIDPYKKVYEITKEERQRYVRLLKGFPLTILGCRNYNEAIITKGGVSVKEINPKTMESKKMSGVFFVGEVLDLDAMTGGYNLQIAWSTGYLAGSSIY